MNKKFFIISAAGGNPTAIEIIEKSLDKKTYSQRGREIMDENEKYKVEQCGFLIPKDNHFEMSGGEFCGNAARAAAIILYQLKGQERLNFTMSGFENKVDAKVEEIGNNKYNVLCTFPNFKTIITPIQALGKPANMVDLSGIVHIIIEAEFPKNDYKIKHRQISQDLNLTNRSAVGVCWVNYKDGAINMHPVVWVKAIDSFFYETSCGSGTIATGKVSNKNKIIQPSGQVIDVGFYNNDISLKSEMEVILSK